MMNIYQSITAAMADIEAVGKTGTNKMQGYKYRSVDDVMTALNPIFAKHKIFAVPSVVEEKHEERESRNGVLIYSFIKVQYTFYAEDGSSVTSTTIGEAFDSGDKSSNKALASAFKYAMCQTFCIPTEDTKDVEEDSPAPLAKPATKAQIANIIKLSKQKGLKNLPSKNGKVNLSDLTVDEAKEIISSLEQMEDAKPEGNN